ncbi:MAG: PAS domain S-box protein, partial [Desulfuromonadales bacterium]
MSIRNKLLLTFLALIILPSATIGYIAFVTAKDSLTSSSLDSLAVIADMKRQKIESYVAGKRRALNEVRPIPLLHRELESFEEKGGLRSPAAIENIRDSLDRHLAHLHPLLDVEDIVLTNDRLDVVYMSNKTHETLCIGTRLPEELRQSTAAAGSGNCVTRIIPNLPYSIFISRPIRDEEGSLVGMIALEVSLETFKDMISGNTGLGESGRTVVGKKLSSTTYTNLLSSKPAEELRLGSEKPFAPGQHPMQEAVQGRNGRGFALNCLGTEIVAAWRHIPSVNLGLVTAIDKTEAFASIGRLRTLTLVISIGASLCGGLLALFVYRSIANPLRQLQRGAQAIGAGNLDVEVALPRRDEIGLLSRNFDEMAKNLKQVTASRDELHREIAERCRVETQIRNSEERYRDLVDNASDLIQSVSTEGSILMTNRAWRSALGYSLEEVADLNLFDLIDSDCAEHCSIAFQQLLAGEDIGLMETTFIARDGRKIFLEGHCNAIVDEKGQAVATRGIFRDVTERRKATLALEEERSFLQKIIDGIPEPIFVIGTDYNIQLMNSFAQNQYNLT